MKKHLLSLVMSAIAGGTLFIATATAHAADLQWSCNWPDAHTQPFTLYHGETATFSPTFLINGAIATNIAISAVYYQR